MRKKDRINAKKAQKRIKKANWTLENTKACENNKPNVIKIGGKVKAIEQARKYIKECFLLIINALGFLRKSQESWQYIYSQKANTYY